MAEQTPIVIIGSGLAGYSLAREFRKLDKQSPLMLITRDDGASYSKPMLSTGFTKGKDAEALMMSSAAKMAEQLTLSVRTHCEVERIDASSRTLFLDDGEQQYNKLILATGASVNKIKFPGSDLHGVVSINDLNDYRNFRALATGKKKILIMGAGLIGCEYANDLLIGGYEIEIIDPSPAPLNGLIPNEAGKAVLKGLSDAGVNFHLGRSISEIQETNSGLCATLDNGETLEGDLIISAIGLRPNTRLAETAGLACRHGIQVDRSLQTSNPNIYALGDGAEVDGHVMLYVLPLMASARALAKTLAGEPTQVHYGVMPVATKTPACPVIVSPPLTNEGSWRFESDGLNVKGLFEDEQGELTGFVLTGDCIAEKQMLAKQIKGIHDN
jgi:rubredoxin-NAD+ reductase